MLVAVGRSPAAQGSWEPPIDLSISCNCCSQGGGVFDDEIAHVSLIPAGGKNVKGSLLVWTRCDFRDPATDPPYKTWIWNPGQGTVSGVPLNLPFENDYGPFCAGHCWLLFQDAQDPTAAPVPKLLTVGGREMGTTPQGIPISLGSKEVITFNPLTEAWEDFLDLDNPAVTAAGDGPEIYGYYYPSVIPVPVAGFQSSAYPYFAASFGGSAVPDEDPHECSIGTGPYAYLPDYSLLMGFQPGGIPLWTFQDDLQGYRTHQYPRTLVLSTNHVLQVGHAVTCESGVWDSSIPGSNPPSFGYTPDENCPGSYHETDSGTEPGTPGITPCDLGYGRSPVHSIAGPGLPPTTVLDPNDPTHPDSSTLRPANPEATAGSGQEIASWVDAVDNHSRNVGAWNYVNVALLHTLKDSWTFPTVPQDTSYMDLDRVLATGGTYKKYPAIGQGGWYHGIRSCLELDWSAGRWRAKQAPPIARALGASFVILPTRELFLVGGAEHNDYGTLAQDPSVIQPYLFDPGSPGSLGTWTPAAQRHTQPGPNGQTQYFPRGYHSAAILLPNGTVALMGGRMFEDVDDLDAIHLDSRDSVEVYRPDYLAPGDRPVIDDVPETIHYQTPTSQNLFVVETGDAPKIDHACLIGVGSVTHHFDYGQRLIELPVRQVAEERLEVVPPADHYLAPPGYYLFFLLHQNGKPSPGEFVLVDYQ